MFFCGLDVTMERWRDEDDDDVALKESGKNVKWQNFERTIKNTHSRDVDKDDDFYT
jgi:hypothetical protein